MIETSKTINGTWTVWEMTGHAQTDICNGYSALLYTFCEELRNQTEGLEYEIERSNLKITGDNDAEEWNEYRGEKDHTRIKYKGEPVCEHYFETGIRLLSEQFPEEVRPLQIIKAKAF